MPEPRSAHRGMRCGPARALRGRRAHTNSATSSREAAGLPRWRSIRNYRSRPSTGTKSSPSSSTVARSRLIYHFMSPGVGGGLSRLLLDRRHDRSDALHLASRDVTCARLVGPRSRSLPTTTQRMAGLRVGLTWGPHRLQSRLGFTHTEEDAAPFLEARFLHRAAER